MVFSLLRGTFFVSSSPETSGSCNTSPHSSWSWLCLPAQTSELHQKASLAGSVPGRGPLGSCADLISSWAAPLSIWPSLLLPPRWHSRGQNLISSPRGPFLASRFSFLSSLWSGEQDGGIKAVIVEADWHFFLKLRKSGFGNEATSLILPAVFEPDLWVPVTLHKITQSFQTANPVTSIRLSYRNLGCLGTPPPNSFFNSLKTHLKSTFVDVTHSSASVKTHKSFGTAHLRPPSWLRQ